ncbi:AraC family transcriptional regulator [Mycobacteroides chelonae]
MSLWDGTRPRTPRTLTSHCTVDSGGVKLAYVTEQVATPTDWFFRESDHVLVIHRHGHLDSMEVELESGPRGRANPQVGDIWVIPAEHRYDAMAHGTTVGYCQLSLAPELLGNIDIKPAIHQRDPLTHQIVEQIGTLGERDDVFARLFTESLLQSLLQHLYETVTGKSAHPPWRSLDLDRPTRARLLEYLDDNLDAKIGLDQLAAYTAMTVPEFTNAFATAFGTTPHQFLLDRRITKAEKLLAESAQPIAEISTTLGFRNPGHFASIFKSRVGVTPSTYRKYL